MDKTTEPTYCVGSAVFFCLESITLLWSSRFPHSPGATPADLPVYAGNQERNKKRIVEMIVNNAIEKAEKKSMRKLFQSKYDKRGCLILRDKDFEVG